MVSWWHGASTHASVLIPYQARKELNLADVEPEEDPQAKDWNTIGGSGWLVLVFADAQGRQTWGLPLAGNIVAIPEDLVAFSQGIVREKGKDWTSFIASQAPLLDLFSWIQELVQVSTRSAEGFVQTMTLINNVG